MSFDHLHYVADVRWKAVEREALRWLGKGAKSQLTPLIELIPRNFQTQEIEKDSVKKLARDEWFYWREQVQLLSKGVRWPTFGDFTVQHAIFKEPKKNCNPSASIRYTFDDYWVILRGHGLKNKDSLGNAQYTAEAKLLCDMDEFCRPQFSEGDRYIYEASKTPNGAGNPTTWIRAGINHHMVYAVRQIAAFAKTALRRTA